MSGRVVMLPVALWARAYVSYSEPLWEHEVIDGNPGLERFEVDCFYQEGFMPFENPFHNGVPYRSSVLVTVETIPGNRVPFNLDEWTPRCGTLYETAQEIVSESRARHRTIISQGLCETTLTERFRQPNCKCATYADNLGPCAAHFEGANGRCVFCDHEMTCKPEDAS